MGGGVYFLVSDVAGGLGREYVCCLFGGVGAGVEVMTMGGFGASLEFWSVVG